MSPDSPDSPVAADVAAATRAWVEQVIVGWGLCPFARGLAHDDRMRVRVYEGAQLQGLLEALAEEVARLLDASPAALETTLLVHPNTLGQFEAQLDFMGAVEGLLEELGAQAQVQVVTFHPDHRFGDATDPAGHFANRAPFACLHLLRESSVSAAVDGHPDIAEIPRANAAALIARGEAQLHDAFAALRRLASATTKR